MFEIQLTRGKRTFVDLDTYVKWGSLKWYADEKRGYFYATHAFAKPTGGQQKIKLADLVLVKRAGHVADHISGDTLDDRRDNLRYATDAQNRQNRRKPVNGKNPFKGVYRYGVNWIAKIGMGGKQKSLGIFSNPKVAAAAYEQAAAERFGIFVRAETKGNVCR